MDPKLNYIRHSLEGAKLAAILTKDEADAMLTAAQLILSNRSLPDCYQTISFDRVCKLLDTDRKTVIDLWEKHQKTIMKLNTSPQSPLRVYLVDFVQIQTGMQKNFNHKKASK